MAVKIYVDLLFLTNLIFDYILLCFTAIFTKSVAKPLRLIGAATAGGFFAVISFFCVKNAVYSTIASLAVSVIMIVLAFGIRDFFTCMRLSAVLYVCTFTLGGACLALIKSDGFFMAGGAFYADIGLAKLLTAGFLTYILSNISYGIVLSKRAKAGLLHEIIISNKDKKVQLNGFYDTGNIAKDENGVGIVFAFRDDIEHLLNESEFETVLVRTVSGDCELKAFIPDEIYAAEKSTKKRIKRKVAVSAEKVKGEYSLILPNDFFDYD